jgi:hypothetical protein
MLSALLYAALFINEARVLEWLSRGGWYALFPVAAALVFSLVHGTFTDRFWTALGVTERRGPATSEEPDR